MLGVYISCVGRSAESVFAGDGTLRDTAGAHTLRITTGVSGNIVGRSKVGGISELTDSVRMAPRNQSESWWRSCNCTSPNEDNSDTGAGWSSASFSILAILVKFLAEDVAGMVQSCGKT